MYKSVYLYEQLKHQTVKENYISTLNAVTESVHDVSEVKQDINDTMKSIEEETNKKSMKLFDKRRSGVVTAKKLLSKYKSTSKSSKPYGLVHKEYKTFKTDDDIKRLHENAIKYLDQFNPATASDVEVKLFISDISDNAQYKALCTIFGEGNEKCSVRDCAVAKKETKELTKNDIEEAVAYLENFTENNDKYNIIRESYDTYGLSKERKIAANYKTALIGIADAKYYELMTEKLTLEFAQAAQIMQKASCHNPRNLKESKEVQEYIDFLYKYEV